jgi:hypothetical protein
MIDLAEKYTTTKAMLLFTTGILVPYADLQSGFKAQEKLKGTVRLLHSSGLIAVNVSLGMNDLT